MFSLLSLFPMDSDSLFQVLLTRCNSNKAAEAAVVGDEQGKGNTGYFFMLETGKRCRPWTSKQVCIYFQQEGI